MSRRPQPAPMPARDAIEAAGGTRRVLDAIAELTGDPITRQSLHNWAVVPATRAWVISALSGISLERIRPDVFVGELYAEACRKVSVAPKPKKRPAKPLRQRASV